MAVRADEKGVGWAVFEFRGANVDVGMPFSGDLAEVHAIGEDYEDRASGVQEFGEGGDAVIDVQGVRLGAKAPVIG